MSKQIKVVKIVDEFSVVINAGSNDGIAPDDTFEIYSPGVEITDPDTGESLGCLDYVKDKICVTTLYPKMSLCQNKNYLSTLSASITANMVGFPAELNVASEDITGIMDNVDRRIRVGDYVRKIPTSKLKKSQDD